MMSCSKTTFFPTWIILLLGMVTLSGGCNNSNIPPDLPRLTPCKLTFTQDDLPLAGANVMLFAIRGGQQWFPCGMTGQDGSVELRSNGRYHGAPAGLYKVVVTLTESEPSSLPPEPPVGTEEHNIWVEKVIKEKLKTFSLVEKQYMDASTTPLEMEITDDKPAETTFSVGKKVRIRI